MIMTEEIMEDVTGLITNINLQGNNVPHPLNGDLDDCEEVTTTDSEEYLSEPLRRYQKIKQQSMSRNGSNSTLTPETMSSISVDNNDQNEINLNNIQVPIVGYEVMEERARFTVFKLRIENKASGDCWYVFRRYTDFVRLCNKLKYGYPYLVQLLPRKKWIGNNFDPIFLDERLHRLQTFINAILKEPNLTHCQLIQDFLCLNEPPVYSDTNQESRAIFEALEETIYHIKNQLGDKEHEIDKLHDILNQKSIENENLKKALSARECSKCQQYFSESIKIEQENSFNNNQVNRASCSTT